jgi:hypothetical protein
MRKVSTFGRLLLIAMVCWAASGCAMFESACTKALPTISAAQVYTDDLVQWVGDVRAQVSKLPLPPDKLAQIEADLEKVGAIARAAYDAEALAINACSKPDVSTIFGNVVALVDDVIATAALFGAKPGTAVKIPQPLIAIRLRRS